MAPNVKADLAAPSGRQAFDGIWPLICELVDCQGDVTHRARVGTGNGVAQREVYVCDVHFSRHFRHMSKTDIDKLR